VLLRRADKEVRMEIARYPMSCCREAMSRRCSTVGILAELLVLHESAAVEIPA